MTNKTKKSCDVTFHWVKRCDTPKYEVIEDNESDVYIKLVSPDKEVIATGTHRGLKDMFEFAAEVLNLEMLRKG